MPQAPRTQAPRRRVSAAAAGWLLLAPPFVLMGLRSWLDAQQVHQTAQTGFALTAVSARGTQTVDTFSLSGITAATNAAKSNCQ